MLNANQLVHGKRSRTSLAIGCVVASSVLAMAGNALAAEWMFNPYVGVGETYTDNAFGDSTDRKDDFITSLSAGFTIEGVGRRLQLTAAYELGYDKYARYSELDGFTHNLLASANTELVSEHLFLDTEIALTEERFSSDGDTSFSDRTTTSDTTRVLNTRISPYYVHDFGGFATATARYTHLMTNFSDTSSDISSSEPGNSQTNRVDLALQSGREFARTKWGLEAFALDNQVSGGDDLKRATFEGSGQMPINRYVALLGIAGWDEFDGENINNEKISGAFYGGGFRLTPGPRTDLSVQIGHRFGGGIVDADFTYLISSEASFVAGYHVDVAGSGEALADTRVLDQNGRLVNPNYFPGGYVDAITKTKTFSMGLAGEKGRNSYSAAGSYIVRDFLADGTDEEVASIDGRYARQLSRQLEWSILGGYSKVLNPQMAGDESATYYGQTGINYQFTPTLSGDFSYSHFNRNSDNGVDDYRENVISVYIRKDF
ncbi:TIGR03016 family PEP-CTERM system-associated outer membrane protein [uncultured Sneathiella sp.]|uniref:TIGR03016 family PEP-CTERM system-associated outer membrane protein n=1 Tax=uncultured Sneathiella sp. TaxID=879315 RepID=UPI0030EEB567